MTVRRLRIACWIPKATDTQAEYVILIACLLQQWLYERASVLPTPPALFNIKPDETE
jgi:hypothetical protein